jgi:hypothetical protein
MALRRSASMSFLVLGIALRETQCEKFAILARMFDQDAETA